MSTTIKFARLTSDAKLPEYKTAGAACFDFYSSSSGIVNGHSMTIFDTGIACEIPAGKVMLVYSRSGHGFKSNTRLCNCVGVIDSDYRGEIKVGLQNDGDNPIAIHVGDRIAQGMIVDAIQYQLVEVPYEQLSSTERGNGGFGSTGK